MRIASILLIVSILIVISLSIGFAIGRVFPAVQTITRTEISNQTVTLSFILDFSNDYYVLKYVDTGSIVIIALFVAGLFLPYRKFFPLKQPRNTP
jgi:hypothetical protein